MQTSRRREPSSRRADVGDAVFRAARGPPSPREAILHMHSLQVSCQPAVPSGTAATHALCLHLLKHLSPAPARCWGAQAKAVHFVV
jgi:hypothetical protein